MKRISLVISAAFIGFSFTLSSAQQCAPVQDGESVIIQCKNNPIPREVLTATKTQGRKDNVLFIVDISGSMREPAGNETKIAAAKKAFSQTMGKISDRTNVGLMVFGRRQARNSTLALGVPDPVACRDIEVLSHLGVKPAQALATRIESFQPRGETPIAASLLQAKDLFAAQKGENNSIVLVTDGREECGGNVCRAAEALKSSGVGIKVHIVGLGHKPEDRKAVECITNITGGEYVAANDGPSLVKALESLPPVELAQAPLRRAPPKESPPVIAQAPPPPPARKGPSCKSNSFFTVCMVGASARGRSVSVALTVTNKTSSAHKITMFDLNGWAHLTGPSGEKKIISTNGIYWGLQPNATEHLSFVFIMQAPIERDAKFDFAISFKEPASQFSFLNIPAALSDEKLSAPTCKKGQYFEVCMTGISNRGTTVNVEFEAKNLWNAEITIRRYQYFAILTAPDGQAMTHTEGGQYYQVPSGGSVQFSESFTLRQPVSSKGFDVVLLFEEPWSQFGFFNVNAN